MLPDNLRALSGADLCLFENLWGQEYSRGCDSAPSMARSEGFSAGRSLSDQQRSQYPAPVLGFEGACPYSTRVCSGLPDSEETESRPSLCLIFIFPGPKREPGELSKDMTNSPKIAGFGT